MLHLKLWYDNPICKQKKQLVKEQEYRDFLKYIIIEIKLIITIKVSMNSTNRELKLGLKKNIKLNKIDAFTYGK